MKAPEPLAKRYFFVPSSDGEGWELAEATYRRRAWEVAYPGATHPDRFDALPPPKADWVELVPPPRLPKAPWPPKVEFDRPMDLRRKPIVKVEATPPPPPPPKKEKAKPAPPRKAIPSMSKDLAELLREQQLAEKAPEGMAKCPLCGAIIQPTKTKKVRTHDDPLQGARCEASNRPWADFGQKPPPPTDRH